MRVGLEGKGHKPGPKRGLIMDGKCHFRGLVSHRPQYFSML